MRMRTAEGNASRTPHEIIGSVGSAAPPRPTVTEGEVTFARLLKIGSGVECAAVREVSVAARAMVVAMLGTMIALVVLALGSLR